LISLFVKYVTVFSFEAGWV